MSCQCLLLIFVLDIDECANNTDNCDVNAYCNNTVGSYNCTCYPEYTGNGTSCTGNFMYDTSPKHILLLLSSQCPLSIPQKLQSAPVTCLQVLSFCPSLCLSVCLSVRPSVCLSVCLSVCPSVCLFVQLCDHVYMWSCVHVIMLWALSSRSCNFK